MENRETKDNRLNKLSLILNIVIGVPGLILAGLSVSDKLTPLITTLGQYFAVFLIAVVLSMNFAGIIFNLISLKKKSLFLVLGDRNIMFFVLLFLANLFIVFWFNPLFGNPDVGKRSSTKTRIVILLPLNDEIRSSYQDGMRQMYGYADYLKYTNSKYTNDFELVPVSHDLNPETAKERIKNEILQNGTKYFISTMSKVNEPLSAEFDEILRQTKYEGVKPVLICTVTSSPGIKIQKNLIYRFYIRSEEEGKALAETGNEKGLDSAISISVADAYGKGAVKKFKENWKGYINEGVEIPLGESQTEITELIKEKFAKVPVEKRKAIFIAHYGNGIGMILKALDANQIKGTLLATSPIGIKDWQDRFKDELKRYDWYTSVPDYKSALNEGNKKNDIIKNFVSYTIERLIQSLNKMENDKSLDFDTSWRKSSAELDIDLDIRWDQEGDSIIPLKVKGKKDFGY